MGVIKQSSISTPVSDSIEDVLDEIQHAENEQEPDTRRPKKIKQRNPKPQAIGDSTVVKAKGGKKKKRVENFYFLLSMAEPEEKLELSVHDFIPPRVSVFSQLFIHMDQIEIWHDFINCTKEREEWFQKNVSLSQQEPFKPKAMNYDQRSDHPAYVASKCYQKIDGDLRLMLKKKHIPLGLLMHLEQELVTFFVNRPNSVYHCQIPSSFERVLMHALSQYLDLSSLSYNRSGSRWTRVRNKQESFQLPPILLSSFLENRYRNVIP